MDIDYILALTAVHSPLTKCRCSLQVGSHATLHIKQASLRPRIRNFLPLFWDHSSHWRDR